MNSFRILLHQVRDANPFKKECQDLGFREKESSIFLSLIKLFRADLICPKFVRNVFWMILLQKICSSTSISQVPFLVDSIIVFVKQLLLSVKKTLQTICPSANSPCRRCVGFFCSFFL